MVQHMMHIEEAKQAFSDNMKIRGHLAYLDGARLVFLGKCPEDRGHWYLGFRNDEGDDTRIKLSHEAMAMLMQLYRKPPNGDDIFPMQITTVWTVTPAPAEEEKA